MKNIVKNTFNLIFIICFGYILYNAIFNNGVNLFIWDKTVMIIGILANISILLLIYKYISEKEHINTKVLIPIFIIIIFIFQCVIGNLFRVSPNWDMKELFQGATEYINGTKEYLPYLYRYSNNIAIQIIFIILFKISDLLKIISYYDIGMLFNAITIDIALVLTYLVAKRLFGSKKAFMVFLMVASMTPIYLFVPIIYTDTMSMMFPLLILYLYLLAKEKDKAKSKYVVYLLMGIVICIGASIKFTIVIMPIAIIIYEIINRNGKELMQIMSMVMLVIIMALSIKPLVIKSVFRDWNSDEYNNARLPITHWIMMGLGDIGKYSEKDVKITTSFDNVKDKKQKNIEIIKDRVNDILKNRKMNFVRRKLMYTWGDGTYFAANTLDYDPINKGIHQDFVFKRGEHHQYYQYYTQIQHITIITLMVAISIFSINKEINYNFLLRISIFGLFLFLLIWETRSRYIVNYLPIMQIVSFIGVEELYKKICNLKRYKLIIGKKEDGSYFRTPS